MRVPFLLVIARVSMATALLLASGRVSAAPLVITDEVGRYPLGLSMDILEDRDGTLDIDAVRRSPAAQRFRPSTTSTPTYGFTRSVIWVRFELADRRHDRDRLFLVLDVPFYDSLELYHVRADGACRKQSLSGQVPFSRRLVDHRTFIFPLEPTAGVAENWYLRVKSEDSMILPLTICTQQYCSQRDRFQTFLLGAYYGAIVIMLLYNLFLLISLRDLNYLFYVLYIISYGMFQLTYNGISFLALWPDSPLWNLRALPFFTALGLSAGLAFARSFLEIGKHYPRLDLVFRVFIVASVLFGLASPFIEKHAGLLAINTLAFSLSILTLSAAVLAVWRGYGPARYFLAGWSFFLGGVMVVALMNVGVVEYNVFTTYAAQIGSLIEITLLSLALADRITVMKRDKEAAQAQLIHLKEEQRQVLEEEVEQRTAELQLERNRLRERQEIMEHELHLARRIQQQYVPNESPVPWIGTIYRPMEKIGGDFFDFIRFRDPARLGIFVSDVSGHGVPAALVTSMVKTAILESSIRRERPAELLSFVNEIICQQGGGNYVTAVYGIYTPSTKGFTYAMAGHPPAMVIGAHEVQEFAIGRSLPLGIMTNEDLAAIGKPYREHTVTLQPSTKLLLYTDGLTEARGGGEDLCWEYAGMRESLLRHRTLRCDDFVRAVMADLAVYRNTEMLDDDVCLVCLDVIED